MKSTMRAAACAALLFLISSGAAQAATYRQTVETFRNAHDTSAFFSRSHAYAVFPTVGSGALGVGGAYGKGRVYVGGRYVGDASIKQLSVGAQAGGKAYSQIIFFEDQRALEEFESGNFEFGADASVVAITAGANATATTSGSSVGASATSQDATTRGGFEKGMATFTIAKGGLMYSASVAGQKFSYRPRAKG